MNHALRHLLVATGGSLLSGRPLTAFSRVSIDTRTIRRGDVFFAIRGTRLDGHDFLTLAAERGASAVVVDRVDERLRFHPERCPDVVCVNDTLRALQQWGRFCREESRGVVIGVTGSNGKTTTKEMLASILKLSGRTLATKGNLNNHIGLPLTLSEMGSDTEFAVIEMGTSKKGDMDVLMEILKPTVGLITNVGKDHLEFLGTPEGVLKENQALYDGLPHDGTAILNLDDPLLVTLDEMLKMDVVTYGMSARAKVRASDIKPWPLPLQFRLHIGDESYDARLNVPGSFQVHNALAAAATAHAVGVPAEKIIEGLATFKPAAMRMQVTALPDGAVLINDAYNANPSSVRASIASFCESYTSQPRWVVLGDMRELGPIARAEHRELGRWLINQPIARIFLYGRDTRFILEGLGDHSASLQVDRFQKKRYLIEALKAGMASEKPAILFKASRSLKLEDAIQPLIPGSAGRAPITH